MHALIQRRTSRPRAAARKVALMGRATVAHLIALEFDQPGCTQASSNPSALECSSTATNEARMAASQIDMTPFGVNQDEVEVLDVTSWAAAPAAAPPQSVTWELLLVGADPTRERGETSPPMRLNSTRTRMPQLGTSRLVRSHRGTHRTPSRRPETGKAAAAMKYRDFALS
mmetsp:Transcript_90271/g.239808  ORF Transcript_90271/g.239808 Transcript_90271/m.239808 type:complete len:171 (-) Transcript_90271:358-870(-)